MFRTKKEVERHVADTLSMIHNESEKLLKGFIFARLFFNVKDYESAKKYLTGFLSIRDHYAPSHKLMAQIYEATNNPENALQSYKRSLEIDPQQKEIVLKICELYCQLPTDHETARYWADRAEQLYPHHDTVFKLREYLVTAEGEPDRHELENLIASDLVAQPKNVDRRIKLLRLYLDTERVKEAYDHATTIETKRLFPYSIDWYYLLCDIFEAYQEENEELDSQFFINYLTALDHLVFLTLAEPHALENGKKSSSLNDAAAILLTFDQLLKKADQKNIGDGSWIYFINHMKGQLYYHMTSLLMKRAKMDQGNRKEAFKFSAGLAVVCYTFKPVNLLHEVWFSQMNDNQKIFTNIFQQASLRISFMGHVLLNLCKDNKSNWLQKIKTEVCIPQVKERIYSRIFSSLFQKEKLSSSYFISDTTFENSSLELPSEVALKEYDKTAYKLCPDSLHHLVWLELHRENVQLSSHGTIIEIFKHLQYSNKNLSKGSVESLCVLDLEAFLQSTVYESKLLIERKNNIMNARNDSHLSYPPDISDSLCSSVQSTWWKAAYGLYTSSIKEKLGEHRRILQRGLEVIRGIGSHGMEVQLVIHLAHIFSSKANSLDKVSENKSDKNKNKFSSDTANALYSRAIHYWNIALGMLEKLASGKTFNVPKDTMFVHSNKSLSKNDIKAYQEEGQLFLAVRLMDTDKLNEAAEFLSKLSSPYGSYYLALTLKKLAFQEERFSSTKAALLNKAKSSLLETMDRIKDDKIHPLNKELFIELEEVENAIAFELSIVNENVSDEADEMDAYDESSNLNLSYSLHDNDNSTAHSTPRPSSKFMAPRRTVKPASQTSPTKHFAPSPERLDAQIRALALNQDTFVKSIFQQQQTLLETNKSIVDALKQNKDVVEQLKKQLEELSLAITQRERFQLKEKVGLKKPFYTRGQGDEEEDYYDPNAILDYYEDTGEDYRLASGYNFDRAARLAHDPAAGASAPLNYGVPPTLPPPGPPPAVNHYNYQYPPHGLVPTPPPVVPGRPPYYHPPPGQGLPFNEGQQLPQFHFHVASAVAKPPPLSTSLSQVVLPRPSSATLTMMSAALNPPPVPPPLTAPNHWPKSVSLPHAFQIPLPPSAVIVSGEETSITPTVTQYTPPSVPPTVTTSHSQLKDLLQTPPTTRTITFGQSAATVTPTALSVSPSLFAGLNKTPEISTEHPRYDSATSPDVDGHDLEREVMGDFKPLIPLPAEIVVETGEENEIVLFEDRAKLYRFIDQEWKERGIGVIKILHHESSGRIRLLMRRDQVLKVCANHYITSNMEIHPLKNSDKAWTWVAQDFADEELRPEHFCIRFKTPEIAADFKAAFDKAIYISKGTEAKKVASPKATATVTSSLSSKSFGEKFAPKPGSWTCPTCYVSNPGDKLLCVACETKKPSSQTPATSVVTSSVAPDFGEKFAPKPGSWSCPTCLVSNPGDRLLCAACETKKPSLQTPATSVVSSSVASDFGEKFLPKPGSWSCPTCYVGNPRDRLLCAACETKKPGSQTPATSVITSSVASDFGAKFMPKPGSWSCPTCYVSNPGEKLLCAACETKKPGSQTSATSVIATSTVTSGFGGMPFQTPITSANVNSSVISGFSGIPFQTTTTSGPFKFGLPTTSSSSILSTVSSTTSNSAKNVFGGFTFSSNPVIQEVETPETKDREILLVSTKAKNGPQVTKVNAPNTSPFTGFSFHSPSGTVPSSSSFSDYFDPFSQLTTSTATATTSSISISSIQSSMQNINPSFVFSQISGKEISTNEAKISTPDSDVTGSVFNNLPSDTSKSGGDFVFGMKPAPQPTTFTFGLSGLSNKSNETVGFTPAFSSTSSAPAVFGGSTQKVFEKPEVSQSASIFGGTSKSDSSSTIFGGMKKTDISQNKPIFGGINQPPEANPTLSSMFGGTKKTESSTPVFGKTNLNTETVQNKPVPIGLTEKSEAPTLSPVSFGIIQKPDVSSSIPIATSSSTSVFNFSASTETKEETAPLEFRFGSPQKYEFNFSGVRPRSPTKTPKSPATPSDVEEEEENESFDADNIYFQPVIPLPPKVDVKTGEENERTLFCKRAKLFRFCSGEWKERGIGDFKILYDDVNKKIRLLMRRDQVLKVCLNHYLTKDISFEKRGDKTLSWAATDFSENEPTPELFALRFKTSEFADEFMAAIENALNTLNLVNEKQNSKADVSKAAASFSFKTDTAPKTEISSSKADVNKAAASFSFKTDTVPITEFSSSKADVSKAAASFSFKTDTAPKTEFSFTPGSLSSRFGASNTSALGSSTDTSSIFSFKGKPSSSIFFKSDFASISKAADDKSSALITEGSEAQETNKGGDEELLIIYESLPSADDVALAKTFKLPSSFYMYKYKPPCPGCIGCEDYKPPPKNTASETTVTSTSSNIDTPTKIEQESEQPSESTMFNTTNAPSFADLALKSSFSGLSTSSEKKGFEGAGTPLFANLNCSAEGDKDEDTVDPGPDPHFEPIIPLPELIAVKTGEEDETPIFTNRAKLFRFDGNKKEWKERGVGDIKILKHNEKLRFRIILRRDQVHKIACNHCIDENMELSPLATSETALCWNALDYSDGQPEASQFAVRFKTKDQLEQFRHKFNECRDILKNKENSEEQSTTQVNIETQSANIQTSSEENVTDNQHDHVSSGSETNGDEDEEDSENDSLLFEKRVSFEISEGGDDQFQACGLGLLKVIYDDNVYGYRVCMNADNGVCLSDHIIAIQTVLRTDKKKATWGAIDLSVDPPRPRRFRATFSSLDAVIEFNSIFQDGKEAALHSEIVEKTDYFFTPTGQNT